MSARVLVVDDNEDILKLLKDNLELDGYTVRTAPDGRTALDRFAENRVDVVLLDLMLPDMDGIRVCRAIRTGSDVPIILLTARDGIHDKVLGLESGADDYLVKPFDYLELEARIKARLRRRGPFAASGGSIEAGRIRIDPGSRTVTMAGKPVPLTRKEFDLLHLLVKHRGAALDRDAIRKALWPNGRKLYRWSRAIDVHIRHLRAKIEKNAGPPTPIITVQGVGYMFSAD